MREGGKSEAALATYAAPTVSLADANAVIADAWAAILGDAASRDEVARTLNLSPKELPEACPYEMKANESGFGPVDYSLYLQLGMAFASGVAWDLAQDAAKEGIKRAFVAVWQKFVKPKVEEKLPHEGLGQENHPRDER